MIKLTELQCNRNGVPLFEPLTYQIDEGACVELLGPNGAGKTTLLRTVAGIYEQFSGALEAAPVCYQGHRLGLDELSTVVENLQWYCNLAGTNADEARIVAALSRVGMAPHGLREVGRLSQGQQRRVGMARWLLDERAVWVLDEPLTALDLEGQAVLLDLISEKVSARGAVIYATHTALNLPDKQVLELLPLGSANP